MVKIHEDYIRIIVLLISAAMVASWIQTCYVSDTGSIYIAMALISIVLYSISKKIGANGLIAKLYGIDENWRFDSLLGIALGLVFISVMNATSITMGTPSAIYPLTTFAEKVSIISTIAVIGYLASICEETLFRGIFMWFGWHNLKHLALAIIATGIVFAGFHYQAYGAALPAAYVGAFLFSTIACLVTLRTKSLLPSIIMHSMVNINLYVQAQQLLVVGA